MPQLMTQGKAPTAPSHTILAHKNLRTRTVQPDYNCIAGKPPRNMLNIAKVIGQGIDINRWDKIEPVYKGRCTACRRFHCRREQPVAENLSLPVTYSVCYL